MHPAPTPIQNLIVLGDSLSDIGIKRTAPAGRFARAAGLMRTNEVGRYSDGKNWTDFLVEWMGGTSLIGANKDETESLTKVHRTLTGVQSNIIGSNAGSLPPVRYANYAEGGAVAASDWSPAGLGYLKTQVDAYIKARRALLAGDTQAVLDGTAQDQYTGHTLHVIWIGLNDLVTAERPCPENPKKAKAGTGVEPMVDEIRRLVNRIPSSFPTNPAHEHFLLIDLPSPLVSVRYQDKVADKGEDAAADVVRNVAEFNAALHNLATHWPPPGESEGPGANPANISFVAMSDWMDFVSQHAENFELTPIAQEHGPVVYQGRQDPLVPKLRRALTTSDLAHPTEAVYQLIARKIVDVVLNGYTLGKLNPASWGDIRPFRTIG
ncbi:SGNH/GDSL hydrolase family protein [Nocardia xishanensis]|uniref:SGNH/GDSL hydrolase family protein n=1 Tax=Nocardia xishanensis TaxID=238964 RepID=A0ABW7WWZ1_9NOCA